MSALEQRSNQENCLLGLVLALLLVGTGSAQAFEESSSTDPVTIQDARESDLKAFLELSHEELKAGVERRLLDLLDGLPMRWWALPAPRVPSSGKGLSRALAEIDPNDLQYSSEMFMVFSKVPLNLRAAVLEQLLKGRGFTEGAVFAPVLLIQKARAQSAVEEAILIEAWLEWAEAFGRRDVLYVAAADAISLLLRRQGVGGLVEAVDSWMALPTLPEDEAGKAHFYLSQADVLFRVGRNQGAFDAFRKAAELFGVSGDPLNQANARNGEGDILSVLGRNEEALEVYRRAYEGFQISEDRLGQGNSRKGMARAFFRLGRNQDALAAYRMARELFEIVGDKLQQGNSWRGEAEVLLIQGRSLEALAAYRRARELFEIAGDILGQGNSWLGEADILFRLGRNQDALDLYRKAREFFEIVGDILDQGNSWKGEAHVLFQFGRYQEALEGYRNARALFEDSDDQLGQGNSWNGEASVLFRLGRNLAALAAHRRARALFERVAATYSQGQSWIGEGEILVLLERSQDALIAFRLAREIFEITGSPLGQGDSWKGEADAYLRLGRNQEALDAYRRARALFEAVGSELGLASSWCGEADALVGLGKNEDALAAYHKARALFEGLGDVLGQGNSWKDEAIALFGTRSYPEAVTAARRALEIFSGLRSDFTDETARLGFQNRIARISDVLVPSLFYMRQETEAVVAAEEAKARVSLDLIGGHFSERARDGEAVDFSKKQRELQARLAQLEAAETGTTNGGSSANHRLQAELDHQLEQLTFENLLKTKTELVEARPLTAAQIAELVEQTGPVLGFYVADELTIAYLLRPHREPSLRVLPLSWSTLTRRASELGEQLANENYLVEAERNSRGLWRDLFSTFDKELPANGPLLVVPHGPLHQIPFEALIGSDGQPLYERFELSVAPSISGLALLRNRHRPPKSDDLIFAMSSDRGLSLPLQELRLIRHLFGSQQTIGFSQEMATFESYEKLAPRARQLLVVSHGEHAEGNLRQTYLEIQPSNEHDHRLNAAEIATIPLPELELAVLAACDTAVGEARFSDERLDLSRAFLVAGAAAVLATRWQVPDDPRTTQFLVDFYRAYRGDGGRSPQRKDVALSEARRLSIERGDPSAIWAAWVLIGDPR